MVKNIGVTLEMQGFRTLLTPQYFQPPAVSVHLKTNTIMKTSTLTVLLLISFYSFSQKSKPNNMNFVSNGILVVKEETTTREINIDAFWMSDEITNKEYRDFINSLKENPKDSLAILDLKKFTETKNKKDALNMYSYHEILQNVIDTSVWNSDTKFKSYLTDKKYENFPVVGVTFINAVFYCNWKTKVENEIKKTQGKPFVVMNRLPTEFEWEYVAINSFSPTGSEKMHEINRVKSGKKNSFGLYNLNDNISEWTLSQNERGERVIKGSSWKIERKANERIFAKPEFRDNTTGFRIVKSYIEGK